MSTPPAPVALAPHPRRLLRALAAVTAAAALSGACAPHADDGRHVRDDSPGLRSSPSPGPDLPPPTAPAPARAGTPTGG